MEGCTVVAALVLLHRTGELEHRPAPLSLQLCEDYVAQAEISDDQLICMRMAQQDIELHNHLHAMEGLNEYGKAANTPF